MGQEMRREGGREIFALYFSVPFGFFNHMHTLFSYLKIKYFKRMSMQREYFSPCFCLTCIQFLKHYFIEADFQEAFKAPFYYYFY